MGWWRIGDGEDIMGDGPADALGGMRKRIERSGVAPTVQQLLDAISDALHERAQELLADPEALDDRPLVVRFAPPKGSLVSGATTPSLRPPPLDAHVRLGLEEIAEEYRGAADRNPRLREVLNALSFVFPRWAEQWLHGADGAEVVDVVAGDPAGIER